MRVLIVGHGFVGTAVEYGFINNDIDIIDPKWEWGRYVEWDQINPSHYNIVFICVPTPMGPDGSCDASILHKVMKKFEYTKNDAQTAQCIVIKSTVTPKIIQKYIDWPGVIYNPEFLTEKSANEQFVDPPFHIFGGREQDCKRLQYYYETYSLCNPCPVHIMSLEEASFTKYAINSFLATKVTFFNQLYEAVELQGCNFHKIIKAVGSDKRIGHSHTKVPGFDNKKGYGGACFPKDTSAITKEFNLLTLIDECVKINNEYRKQYSLDEREVEQHVNYGQTEEEQQDPIH